MAKTISVDYSLFLEAFGWDKDYPTESDVDQENGKPMHRYLNLLTGELEFASKRLKRFSDPQNILKLKAWDMVNIIQYFRRFWKHGRMTRS